MDKKIFIGLLMVLLVVVPFFGIVFMTSFLINNGGTLGFIAAPFLALILAFFTYKVLVKLYHRLMSDK